MAAGEKVGKFLDNLDHPVPFVFFMLLAIVGLQALLVVGFKRLGMPGPAALFQIH